MQQGLGLFTTRHADHPVRVYQKRQFSCLTNVPVQEDQKLSWPAVALPALVTLRKHVVSQQRDNFFRRDFLADASHAQKRTQGAWNDHSGLLGGFNPGVWSLIPG